MQEDDRHRLKGKPMKWTSDDVNERPQTLRYKLGFAYV